MIVMLMCNNHVPPKPMHVFYFYIGHSWTKAKALIFGVKTEGSVSFLRNRE